jgi:hypothetical protein
MTVRSLVGWFGRLDPADGSSRVAAPKIANGFAKHAMFDIFWCRPAAGCLSRFRAGNACAQQSEFKCRYEPNVAVAALLRSRRRFLTGLNRFDKRCKVECDPMF